MHQRVEKSSTCLNSLSWSSSPSSTYFDYSALLNKFGNTLTYLYKDLWVKHKCKTMHSVGSEWGPIELIYSEKEETDVEAED